MFGRRYARRLLRVVWVRRTAMRTTERLAAVSPTNDLLVTRIFSPYRYEFRMSIGLTCNDYTRLSIHGAGPVTAEAPCFHFLTILRNGAAAADEVTTPSGSRINTEVCATDDPGATLDLRYDTADTGMSDRADAVPRYRVPTAPRW